MWGVGCGRAPALRVGVADLAGEPVTGPQDLARAEGVACVRANSSGITLWRRRREQNDGSFIVKRHQSGAVSSLKDFELECSLFAFQG